MRSEKSFWNIRERIENKMWVERGLNCLCNLFLILIIIRYMGVFFKPEKNKKILILVIFGYYVSALLVSFFFAIPILNFFISIAGIFAISCAFKGNILKKVLIILSVGVLNACCDIIAYAVLAPRLAYMQIDISYLFTILLVLICEQLVSRLVRGRNACFMPDHFVILTLIPGCSLVILYIVANEFRTRLQVAAVAVSLLMINVLVFYIYHVILENYLNRLKYEMIEEKAKAYANELEILSETCRRTQSLQHDMKHHILELKNLNDHQRVNEVREYLENMESAMHISGEYVRSGNCRIDSVLNYLLTEAEEKLTDVQSRIRLPENAGLNVFKLNIILGNLMENAVEAAVRTEEKKLSLEVELDRGILYIRIVNSYNGMLRRKGSGFMTTKSGNGEHGIGLRNVREIVEEENGSITMTADGKEFVTEVISYV